MHLRVARLRAFGCAALAAGVLVSGLVQAPASAAGGAVDTSGTVKEQIASLNAEMDRVARELEEGATAYEEAELRLARLTQEQFAATADRDALVHEEVRSRAALSGLARAAYKGNVPPVLTALMSGSPRALADLAYVQRSIGVVGAAQGDATRELVQAQVGAGRAVERSDALRRDALRQRQELEVLRATLAATTTQLTAELDAAGTRLLQVFAREQAAARARLAAEQLAAADRAAAEQADARRRAAEIAIAAGVPLTVGDTGGGSCLAPSGVGEVNGFLSEDSLCALETARGHRLRSDAARAFDALSRAREAATGAPLCVTDSYRSYAGQVDVFRRKPHLAAVPGRSQHGWGLAVDLCGGVQTFGSEGHRWLQQNAAAYGWVHPRWARQGGSKPEAWHWEYVGVGTAAG